MNVSSSNQFDELKHFVSAVKGQSTWNDLCKSLRNGVRSHKATIDNDINNINSDDNNDDNHDNIAIEYHTEILSMIKFGLAHDNPAHIIFPGTKDSFVQLSAEFSNPRAFTVCMWLKIDEDTEVKGFLLCRCRCPTGGLDVILSERQADGRWLVTMKGIYIVHIYFVTLITTTIDVCSTL